MRREYGSKRLKILFEDEAVFGLFTDVYKVWCRVGRRPIVKKQQSRQYINVFGAVCPATGQTQAMSSPVVNTEAMNVFLKIISEANEGYEVVVFMDRAGWHTANALDVPENVHIEYLPPYSPQLNPAEHIWEYLRMYWTGNRYYNILDDLVQTIGNGFEQLFKNPSIVKSLCNFSWIKDAELL